MKKSKTEELERKKSIRILTRIKNIFFAVILAVLALIIISSVIVRINGNSPSVIGYSMYRVSSASMRPELEVGDIIISKSIDPMSVKKGDIITYTNDVAGEPTSITHRVIQAPFKSNGKYYVKTKGDSNTNPDSAITIDKIDGKLVTKLPSLKAFYDFFITPWGLITLLALIVAAFFNEIIIFFRYLTGNGETKKTDINEIIERYKNEERGSDKSDEDFEKDKENSE